MDSNHKLCTFLSTYNSPFEFIWGLFSWLINCLAYTMSKNSEKCPSQVLRRQSDVFKNACYVRQKVQNPKIFSLLSYKTKTSWKTSHFLLSLEPELFFFWHFCLNNYAKLIIYRNWCRLIFFRSTKPLFSAIMLLFLLDSRPKIIELRAKELLKTEGKSASRVQL